MALHRFSPAPAARHRCSIPDKINSPAPFRGGIVLADGHTLRWATMMPLRRSLKTFWKLHSTKIPHPWCWLKSVFHPCESVAKTLWFGMCAPARRRRGEPFRRPAGNSVAGICLNVRPHLNPLPQERTSPATLSGFAADHHANPVASFTRDADIISPSPGGVATAAMAGEDGRSN